MEHIVQFAIGIDDEAIVKIVNENAERVIINDLKQQVANKLFQRDYYRNNADPERDPLSTFAKGIVERFLVENKDIIIERAAEQLADKLARTKKAKEILNGIKV